ncbi:pentapeptide repeat-containing protein, partial [Synechococcus sp. OH2]
MVETAAELLQRYGSGERDFSNSQLAEADLAGADLAGIDLGGAILQQAKLG